MHVIKGLMLMLLMGVIYSVPVANSPVVAQTPKTIRVSDASEGHQQQAR